MHFMINRRTSGYVSHFLHSLGKESAARLYDVSWFENEIEDNTKLEKIAQYLSDRYGCKKFAEQDMQKEKWLAQWSEFYPNPTRNILYQALIYVGEHASARALLPSQGEYCALTQWSVTPAFILPGRSM